MPYGKMIYMYELIYKCSGRCGKALEQEKELHRLRSQGKKVLVVDKKMMKQMKKRQDEMERLERLLWKIYGE